VKWKPLLIATLILFLTSASQAQNRHKNYLPVFVRTAYLTNGDTARCFRFNGKEFPISNGWKKQFNPNLDTQQLIIIKILDNSDWPIPEDLILAIFYLESGMRQFDVSGKPIQCDNLTADGKPSGHSSWGIGQISDKADSRYPWIDYKRVKWDTKYNIECSVKIFMDKLYQVPRLERLHPSLRKYSYIYVALRLYNGFKARPGEEWEYANEVMHNLRTKPWLKHIKQEGT
jgi:hypothetical protein